MQLEHTKTYLVVRVFVCMRARILSSHHPSPRLPTLQPSPRGRARSISTSLPLLLLFFTHPFVSLFTPSRSLTLATVPTRILVLTQILPFLSNPHPLLSRSRACFHLISTKLLFHALPLPPSTLLPIPFSHQRTRTHTHTLSLKLVKSNFGPLHGVP